jgi:hypothetical protein
VKLYVKGTWPIAAARRTDFVGDGRVDDVCGQRVNNTAHIAAGPKPYDSIVGWRTALSSGMIHRGVAGIHTIGFVYSGVALDSYMHSM